MTTLISLGEGNNSLGLSNAPINSRMISSFDQSQDCNTIASSCANTS